MPSRTFLGPRHIESHHGVTRRASDLLKRNIAKASTFVKDVARSIRPRRSKLLRDQGTNCASGPPYSCPVVTPRIDQALVPFVRSCVVSRQGSTSPQSIGIGHERTSRSDDVPWWVELSLASNQDHAPALPAASIGQESDGDNSTPLSTDSSVVSSLYAVRRLSLFPVGASKTDVHNRLCRALLNSQLIYFTNLLLVHSGIPCKRARHSIPGYANATILRLAIA